MSNYIQILRPNGLDITLVRSGTESATEDALTEHELIINELHQKLTKAENKRITELEAALKYVRETADMQLKIIIDMDKKITKTEAERDDSTDEIILLGNDLVNLKSERDELQKYADEATARVLVLQGCEDLMQGEVDDAKAELSELRKRIDEAPEYNLAIIAGQIYTESQLEMSLSGHKSEAYKIVKIGDTDNVY